MAAVYAALGLPPEVVVDERVPKKVLLENVLLPAPDRRLLQDGLEELRFLATLKPNLCGVAPYQAPATPADADDLDVAEVVVLGARLRPATAAATTRLLELLHRVIPYPILLLADLMGPEKMGPDGAAAGGVVVSLAHKRPAQNATGRLTLREVWHSEPLHLGPPAEAAGLEAAHGAAPARPLRTTTAYLAALALPAVGAPHLRALYQSWLDRTVALEAAGITGRYCPPATPAQAVALRAALATHGRLRQEQATLRRQAGGEKQLARRASLNLRLRQLDTELAALLPTLTPSTS